MVHPHGVGQFTVCAIACVTVIISHPVSFCISCMIVTNVTCVRTCIVANGSRFSLDRLRLNGDRFSRSTSLNISVMSVPSSVGSGSPLAFGRCNWQESISIQLFRPDPILFYLRHQCSAEIIGVGAEPDGTGGEMENHVPHRPGATGDRGQTKKSLGFRIEADQAVAQGRLRQNQMSLASLAAVPQGRCAVGHRRRGWQAAGRMPDLLDPSPPQPPRHPRIHRRQFSHEPHSRPRIQRPLSRT